jgi:hypothetical protein
MRKYVLAATAALALLGTAGWANAKMPSLSQWQRKMDTGHNALNSTQGKRHMIRQATDWGSASLGG